MKLETKLILTDADYNRLMDVMGHAYRAEEQFQYERMIPYLKQAAEELANLAFERGREFERSQTSRT